MTRITTALFDFDGVIADTEGQYARYFDELARVYPPSVADLSASVRGVTLPEILDRFFHDYPARVKQEIADGIRRLELQMDYYFIPDAGEFLRYLKERRYRVALVTSSREAKMRVALDKLGLQEVFDAVVTADKVTRGKPDPECYLLAAATLGAAPGECVVFEDSIAGVTAGKRAGMTVIGLATTLPAAELRPRVDHLIADFSDPGAIMELITNDESM
ncbi:MAG: HAD family phosphatase [Odoribacteraceae bacterium]|jgi:HAD superfamily hydrolase (TIGR01509 family)|nr:HAD family phosphatase [Odoribacteraceae bacterium]